MQIQRLTVKDQIYEIVRDKIISQEYPLGSKINMLGLSKELNVSNTPIREALSMLERDGLIINKPNSGPSVVDFTETSFKTVSYAVEALEIGSLELCLSFNLRNSLIEMLEKQLMLQKEAYLENDRLKLARISMNFDGAIIECTGNEYLAKIFHEMSDIFYLIHKYVSTSDENLIKQHEEILEAIKNNQNVLARELIKKHYSITPDIK